MGISYKTRNRLYIWIGKRKVLWEGKNNLFLDHVIKLLFSAFVTLKRIYKI